VQNLHKKDLEKYANSVMFGRNK